MEFAKSQEQLLLQLKMRGPQSVKVLADQLDMTTMGVRQHLAALAERRLVVQTEQQKQDRGRPLRCWALTAMGHQQFPDAHAQVSVDLIASVRDAFGSAGLDKIIQQRTQQTLNNYRQSIERHRGSVMKQLRALCQLRSEEGYMANVEPVKKGEWLLVENHCPICAAAEACQGFCRSELEVFQDLFAGVAEVERLEHVLAGARRCAYRVKQL